MNQLIQESDREDSYSFSLATFKLKLYHFHHAINGYKSNKKKQLCQILEFFNSMFRPTICLYVNVTRIQEHTQYYSCLISEL